MDKYQFKICGMQTHKMAENLKKSDFLKKYFHDLEIYAIKSKKSEVMQIQSFSARLAAKIAYKKLCNQPDRLISFNKICILNNKNGKPIIYFYDDNGNSIENENGNVLVSLSHNREYAAGFIILNK